MAGSRAAPKALAALPPTIKKRADFVAARQGAFANGALLRVQMRARHDAQMGASARVGFTVTKKCGNATQRNRIKRRLREAVRAAAARDMRPQYDYVIISKADVLTAPFSTLCQDLRLTLSKANKRAQRQADSLGQAKLGKS